MMVSISLLSSSSRDNNVELASANRGSSSWSKCHTQSLLLSGWRLLHCYDDGNVGSDDVDQADGDADDDNVGDDTDEDNDSDNTLSYRYYPKKYYLNKIQ